MDAPYGARTRISTCVSIALTAPYMYSAYCKSEFNPSRRRLKDFTARLDMAQEPARSKDGTVLFFPHVVVCYDTRYKENSLTGLIRILGIGKFGEFSTFTLESLNKRLIGEMKRKRVDFGEEHIFVDHNGMRVLGTLRTYSATGAGKRSRNYRLDLVSPQKDVNVDLDRIEKTARDRYHKK